MKVKLIFTFFSFPLCTLYVFGQAPGKDSLLSKINTTTIDSEKAIAYFDLAQIIRYQDIDLAKKYADTGLTIAQRVNNDYGIHLFDYISGSLAYMEGNYAKAIEITDSYIDWTIKTRNIEREWYALSLLSMCFRESGDFQKGIQSSLRGIEIGVNLNRDDENGFFYNEMGNTYATLKQWDKSNEYFNKSYQLAKKLNYLPGQSVSLRNIASNNIQLKKYEEAKKLVFECIAIDSISKFTLGLSRSHQLLARIQELEDHPELAIHEYEMAEHFLENESSENDKVIVKQGLAKNYLALNQISKASQYLQLADALAHKLDASELNSERLKLHADFYEKQGDYKKALASLRSFVDKNAKELNADITLQITGLHVEFETERKENQIALLSSEKKLAGERLSISKRQTFVSVSAAIIFSLIAYYAYTLWRKTKSQNAQIQKSLSEKETLLKEIHHRVKNNLQFISSLLNLQARHIEDKTALTALKEGQNRVKSMALIHQNLYQENNLTGIELKKYLETLISNLFSSYTISRDKIKLEVDIDSLNLDVDTMIPIGLVINELISNSLKYAFPDERTGTIKVSIKEINQELVIKVQDDGIGISDKEKPLSGKSFGYRLINAFSNQLNAKLEMQTDRGTSVTMYVRDYKKAA
ncbi:MAG: histidine kinase dimerization/phosphoacceptor domain -containing protein [Saprospiraceae bacterium]